MLGSWCNFYHFSDGGVGGGGARKKHRTQADCLPVNE